MTRRPSAFWAGFERMGLRLFNPAGILILLSGVLLVVDGPWRFENASVVIGILIVVMGALLGARVFTPLSRRAQAAHQRALEGPYQRFRAFGALDTGLIILAVALMVLKLGA